MKQWILEAKLFVRAAIISTKMALKGTALTKEDPFFKIVCKVMILLILNTKMSNEEIACFIVATYKKASEFLKEKEDAEKAEILKDAPSVIEKWAKEYK